MSPSSNSATITARTHIFPNGDCGVLGVRDWAKFAGFSAVLAFVLTASFCFALKPSIQTNQRAEQSKQESHTPLAEAPSFVMFRVILPGGLEQISAYCNSYSEEEKKKWPQAYYCELKATDVWLAMFTCLLVFVTGGIVWTAWRQESMARTHERAYISGGGPLRISDANGNPIRPDEGWITIENYGRTPAVILRFEWGFCAKSIFPKDRKLSEIIDRKLLPEGTVRVFEREDVIPPHMPYRQFRGPGSFSLSQENGKIFFGQYIYEDVFHDKHYSTFVLELGPGMGESSSPPGGYSDYD
jgi:hypothetical protein